MRPLAYNSKYALNAICPYFTMFPLEYPLRALKKHKAAAASVLDPFCGRGTTLFAARALGLDSWGIDTSPVAVAIAKAKLSNATAEEALNLAQLLVYGVRAAHVPRSRFFEAAYHPKTLRQLCSLREGLAEAENDTDASVLLRAAVLGCLHGPLLASGLASYFSNQMPRTFAPKPDYALGFWEKRGMVAPEVDVLKVLERKLKLIAASGKLISANFANVIQGDSTLASSLPREPKFSTVVTSPPYYGMRTYVQDQWLRNWFLGGSAMVDYDAGEQLEHKGQVVFAKSLGKVWANMAATKADSLDMYVRFGVIPSSNLDARKLMANSIEESGAPLRIVSTRNASSAHSGKRQAQQMKASSGACDEYDFHIVRH
jgi:SAM-dependent methyltransferase